MSKTAHVIFLVIILATNGEAAKKRVCIVGAGISGLAAAKHFGEYPNEFEPVVFEKNSDVGGQWIYTNSTTVDEHGFPVNSGIYESLKTNAVKEMMTFPDYPHFGGEAGKWNFVKHEDVLQYLRNYTDHFKLRQYVQFNTNVIKVHPLPNLRWQIVAKNWNTQKTMETSCDATVICNGQNVKGYIPKIARIESFTGRVLHSHVYRIPEPFANQTVVVLGAGPSGIDVTVEVSSVAEKIYLSHRRKKLPDVFPPNVEQVPGVVGADGDELILSNGTRIRADALIFCTGYLFDYPFLDASSGIVVEDGFYIRSIYKHSINIERPTMAIIEVPRMTLSFQIPHVQVKYFRAVLRGELRLPSREQMLIEARVPPNVPKSKAHAFPYDQFFIYLAELVTAIGDEPMPWWFAPAVDEIGKIIYNDPTHYKDKRLVIHEDGHVEFV